ncbi:MAG: DNA-directed RNA polymerase subunit N [archaeon]
MIVPVRCFSCGKVLGSYYEEFKKKVKEGKSPEKVLDEMGIERYCCRRTLFSHVDLLDEVLKYTPKGEKN